MSTSIHRLTVSSELSARTAQRLVHAALTPARMSPTGPCANSVFGTSSTVLSWEVLVSAHLKKERGSLGGLESLGGLGSPSS